jgi:hypothetical protein
MKTDTITIKIVGTKKFRQMYVNCHPYVLHLWKPTGVDLQAPPAILVGPRMRHK